MTINECLKIFSKSKYGNEIPKKIGRSDLGLVIITDSPKDIMECNYYLINGNTITPTYPPLCGLKENTIKSIE